MSCLFINLQTMLETIRWSSSMSTISDFDGTNIKIIIENVNVLKRVAGTSF